jgi:hypothetical protein
MTTDTYTTPEGFELHRPLLFPDTHDFTELFTVERAWDFSTMNHRNGKAQAETPEEIRLSQSRVVDRFCSVRNMNRPHLMVTPTDALMERLRGDGETFDDFAFFDRIGFEVIYHAANGRALVIASANNIIASRYLAYVDPTTVPDPRKVTT